VSRVSALPEIPDYEDNDDWLIVDPQDFDEMLGKTLGTKTEDQKTSNAMVIDGPRDDAEEHAAATQAARLKELTSKVENFVEGEGDIEGARFEE
jgi:hypothetical protein